MEENQTLGKFFSENEFQLEMMMAQEYMKDLCQRVWWYAVDRTASNVDDIYHEGYKEEIHLHSPVELEAIVDFQPPTNKSYNDDNTLRINEFGNLIIHTLLQELKDKNCNPVYGDYIVYMVEDGFSKPKTLLFQISNDGNKFWENSKTWGGFKPYFRTFNCTPVDSNELKIEF